MVSGAGSSESMFTTSQAIAARARKSGAGGIRARPSATNVAATTPTATAVRKAIGHVARCPRRNAGGSETHARNARRTSDGNGATPTGAGATWTGPRVDIAEQREL